MWKTVLLWLEFDNAVNAKWLVRFCIDEDIGWMHILQGDTFVDVAFRKASFVGMKPFARHIIAYFTLCGQPLTANVWLCQDGAEKSVFASRKANDLHGTFGKQMVVEGNGIKCFLKSGVDGCALFDNRSLA